MEDAQLTAAIVALVAYIRNAAPKIDGWMVAILATAVGAALAGFAGGHFSLAGAQHGVLLAWAALGGVTLADRATDRVGAAFGRATLPPPAPVVKS